MLSEEVSLLKNNFGCMRMRIPIPTIDARSSDARWLCANMAGAETDPAMSTNAPLNQYKPVSTRVAAVAERP
ncbi:MAG TPA: hypothetical protein VK752_12675 [Bryobacteraceae bacterium]|nr:hypothetical protein [Bryobacteraceae bacterium]